MLLYICMLEYTLCCYMFVCRSMHYVAQCLYVGVCTVLLFVSM